MEMFATKLSLIKIKIQGQLMLDMFFKNLGLLKYRES